MNEPIGWCVELAVKPGQLGPFRELTRDMVSTTAAGKGVLAYQRYVSRAGDRIHAVERYESSAAALAHLRMFAEAFGARFSGMVERQRFTMYGTPSPELKAVLDGYGATYLAPLADPASSV